MLFGPNFNKSHPNEHPPLLIWSLIALSLRFSSNHYFALRKAAAVEYYADRANEELFRGLHSTAEARIPTLQSICLPITVKFAEALEIDRIRYYHVLYEHGWDEVSCSLHKFAKE